MTVSIQGAQAKGLQAPIIIQGKGTVPSYYVTSPDGSGSTLVPVDDVQSGKARIVPTSVGSWRLVQGGAADKSTSTTYQVSAGDKSSLKLETIQGSGLATPPPLGVKPIVVPLSMWDKVKAFMLERSPLGVPWWAVAAGSVVLLYVALRSRD